MKAKSVSEVSSELADREAIRDCLMRYCRGVDRCDRELLMDVYWPDAVDDHVSFRGNGHAFVDYLLPLLGSMDQTMHKLGNILIDIDGDDARCETYFDAFHRLRNESGAAFDLVVGGRYVDRFEKRQDVWKIADRLVVLDWFRQYPDSGEWSEKPLGMDVEPGGRSPNDASYRILNRQV